MSAAEALEVAYAAGVSVWFDGDDLVLEAPAPPPPAVLDLLSRHKASILTLLRPGAPPYEPCAACGGRLFWADAQEPVDRARWHCERCRLAPRDLLRHACALPPQAWQC